MTTVARRAPIVGAPVTFPLGSALARKMASDEDIRFLDEALIEIASVADGLVERSRSPEQAVAVASALTTVATRVYEALGGAKLAAEMFRVLADAARHPAL